MDFFACTDNWPILSVLIFMPLAGALLLPLFGRGRGARSGRWLSPWRKRRSLCRCTGILISRQPGISLSKMPAGFPPSTSTIRVGVDGISLLLVLLTTLIMPLCVLCSWRYIQTRVKEFFACILIMETAMVGVFWPWTSSSSSSSGKPC